MSRYTEWEKEELLRICRRERRDGRCAIVKELIHEAEDLTEDFRSEIADIEAELKKKRKIMNDTLRLHMLLDFEEKSTCRRTTRLHPRLVEYDLETNRQLKQIIGC